MLDCDSFKSFPTIPIFLILISPSLTTPLAFLIQSLEHLDFKTRS